MSPRRNDGAQVVSGNSPDWQETRDLLGGEHEEVGVLALDDRTEVLNGSREPLKSQEFRLDGIDAVRGNYMIFPEQMVGGVQEQVGQKALGPEDMNEANFYVGHSTGVPWFELKFEEDYTIPGREEPHVHNNAWELYSFHGGEAVLDVAGEDYNFDIVDPDTWDYREDISQVEASDGDVLAIPPGVPHQVSQQYGNPDLVVARYSEDGEIGRYNLAGEKEDRWSEGTDNVEMQTYPEALE